MRLLYGLTLLFLGLLSACGGSPTAPESTSNQGAPAVTSPSPTPPEPAPTPPVPPTEPTPTPTPTPAPPPEPGVTYYRATMTSAHWYGAPVLPDAFDVEIRGSQIVFGPLRADILGQDSRSLFARPNGANLQLLFDGDGGGTWSYNGTPGTAIGSLAPKK